MEVEVEIPDDMLPTFQHGVKGVITQMNELKNCDDGRLSTRASIVFEEVEPPYIEVLRHFKSIIQQRVLAIAVDTPYSDQITDALTAWEKEQRVKKTLDNAKPGTGWVWPTWLKAKWIAKDKDDKWFAYTERPSIVGSEWRSDNVEYYRLGDSPYVDLDCVLPNVDWKESAFRNPYITPDGDDE